MRVIRFLKLALLAVLATIAVLAMSRAEAAASESRSPCEPTESFVPALCLNIPTTAIRRDTSVPLVALPSRSAEVRVEVTIGVDAAGLANRVDRAVERVESTFAREFSPRPRVLVFSAAPSFATAMRELFGYSNETARYVANTYAGIFDVRTLTIAINWSAAGHARMDAAIAHELTHLMVRQAAAAQFVPAWFDEGLATVIEEDVAGGAIWTSESDLAGRAIAASGTVTLDQLHTTADFQGAYRRIGRPLYEFTASVVRAMGDRVGRVGLVGVIEVVGRGEDFESAYKLVSGETSLALASRVVASAAPTVIVRDVLDGEGNSAWTLYTGVATAEVTVTITSGSAYNITFTVRTDEFGMYRGSFGSTAPPGHYVIRAAGAQAALSRAR